MTVPNRKKSIAKPHILVVDDDILQTTVLSKQLAKRGYHVSVANGGEDATHLIIHETFDLVLLDVVMGKVSGVDVLQTIRTKYQTYELPVIMATSRSSDEDIIQALYLGANDYLTKPINIEIAAARIATQVQIGRLTKEAISKQQLETVNAMIVTYNHEINNPLAIATAYMTQIMDYMKEHPEFQMDQQPVQKVANALQRICDIMARIRRLSAQTSIEKEVYADNTDMIKLSG